MADFGRRRRLILDPWSKTLARAIGLFAPGTALQFLRNRTVLNHYTGASRKGPDQGWNPSNKSADAILARDRVCLLARARDLERNSSHISGAINKISNNVVYTGIFPQARLKTSDGKLRKPQNDMIEGHFKDWAEADEVQFYDLQELFVRHMWIEGEFFLHRFFDHDLLKRGLCPLGLEILETDFLDSSINAVSENGNTIKGGIEYNRLGRPVAYHLFKEHPGESIWGTSFGDTHRIPATEVKHVFHKRRASQGRGVSWLASIIMEMRDFSEYQTNERIASRLAAAFGIFIESPYPEHQIRHPFDGIEEDNVPSISDIPKYLEPGRIDVLPTGMKISSAQFNRPGQTYEPFTKTSLKSASTGTPLSYENFSNDYEGATYSSARQAVLEERRGYRKMQTFCTSCLRSPTRRAFGQMTRVMCLFRPRLTLLPVGMGCALMPRFFAASESFKSEIAKLVDEYCSEKGVAENALETLSFDLSMYG